MNTVNIEIMKRLQATPGDVGFCYKNLADGGELSFNTAKALLPASVIKLFVLSEAFRRFEDGTLERDREITVPRSACVPSCGAINYLHDNLTLTVRDLCELMIILSDNTATNVLIDLLGMDAVNASAREDGFRDTVLRRKMFDSEKAALGIENATSVRDVARWLELAYRGALVSPAASAEMLSILRDQRLNGKIPFYIHALPNARPIAHKTGEDTRVTHDVGIVYADRPFIVCFMANDVDVPHFERLISEVALELFRLNMD